MRTIYLLRVVFLAITVYTIIFTNPQIELLLDSAYHISGITHLIKQGIANAYSPVWYIDRHAWHQVWAWVLMPFMPLATTTIFKMVYTVQAFATFVLIYLASLKIIRIIARDLPAIAYELMAFSSAFLYLFTTSFFNFSWISMYATSYLITMPISVYICAWLTNKSLNSCFCKKDLLIILPVLAVLLFHAAELVYPIILTIFLIIANLKRMPLKFFAGVFGCLLVLIVALFNIKLLGAKFISIETYRSIFAHSPSNHEIPLTEWVYLAFGLGGLLILLRVIFPKQFKLNFKLLSVCYTYSLFMAYFAVNIKARELFFFEPPYLTARFIYGSLWFIFIPLCAYYLLAALLPKYASYIYLPVFAGLVIGVYHYSRNHDQKFSLIARRLILSHDGDYISRVTYANFAKIDAYLKNYDCHKYIFSGNDDISAAIGIAGCNSDTDYMTFGRISPEQMKELSSKYQLIKVPDLFQQGDNPKYGEMWSIR